MSSIRDVARFILRNLNNLPGWRTSRRIVVIESDDWGSIRIPSKAVYDRFERKGFHTSKTQYNRLDALESNEDMAQLLDLLHKHKNVSGHHACLTANVIVANPDFDRIRSSNFSEYYYEHFGKTLSRYPKHDKVLSLYKEGMNHNLFHPQFHGREHLNVNRWMKDLRSDREVARYTFEARTTYSGNGDYNYMEALDLDEQSELPFLGAILRDGLDLFKNTFGYRSRSFIAPCYTWDSSLERLLHEEGVEFIQGGLYQYVPKGGFDNYTVKRHILGQQNDLGQLYLTRNCFFEPSLVYKADWVDYTLASVRDAFRWNKPAILCTHRINFIGFIDPVNRDKNLRLFDELLSRVIKTWPDIEFMTSDHLGDLIKSGQPE